MWPPRRSARRYRLPSPRDLVRLPAIVGGSPTPSSWTTSRSSCRAIGRLRARRAPLPRREREQARVGDGFDRHQPGRAGPPLALPCQPCDEHQAADRQQVSGRTKAARIDPQQGHETELCDDVFAELLGGPEQRHPVGAQRQFAPFEQRHHRGTEHQPEAGDEQHSGSDVVLPERPYTDTDQQRDGRQQGHRPEIERQAGDGAVSVGVYHGPCAVCPHQSDARLVDRAPQHPVVDEQAVERRIGRQVVRRA